MSVFDLQDPSAYPRRYTPVLKGMERDEDVNGRTARERDEWQQEQERRDEISALERDADERDRCHSLRPGAGEATKEKEPAT